MNKTTTVNKSFTALLNYFGELGGLDSLLQILKFTQQKGDSTLVCPLEVFYRICQFFIKVRLKLNTETKINFFPPIFEALLGRIKKLSDENLKEIKDGLVAKLLSLL